MPKPRPRRDPGLDTALGKMDPISFLKVIMMTAFLNGGEVIHQDRTETTLADCGRAKEEAIRFNNRFLWPWENYLQSDRRVFVACFWHPETKEV